MQNTAFYKHADCQAVGARAPRQLPAAFRGAGYSRFYGLTFYRFTFLLFYRFTVSHLLTLSTSHLHFATFTVSAPRFTMRMPCAGTSSRLNASAFEEKTSTPSAV